MLKKRVPKKRVRKSARTKWIQFVIQFLMLLCGIRLLMHQTWAYASVGGESPLNALLSREIEKNYNSARVQLKTPIRWVQGERKWNGESVNFLGDDGHGNAHFSLQNRQGYFTAEGWVGFSAWIQSRVSVKRVRPGELLDPSFFVVRQIDVAQGQAHDYRGIILPASLELTGLEAIQTILEGQFLISSVIRKTPDIRRGDPVQIVLKSNNLDLKFLGTAQEPSYLHQPVRVLASKTKRELLGNLTASGRVEVQLQ